MPDIRAEKRKRIAYNPKDPLPKRNSPKPSNEDYCVVSWLARRESGVVPRCWTFEKNEKAFTYWPNYSGAREIKNVVLEAAAPDPETWETFEIKVYFTGSYKTSLKVENALIKDGSGAVDNSFHPTEPEDSSSGEKTDSDSERPETENFPNTSTQACKRITSKDSTTEQNERHNVTPEQSADETPQDRSEINSEKKKKKKKSKRSREALEPERVDEDPIPPKKCRRCTCGDCVDAGRAELNFKVKVLKLLNSLHLQMENIAGMQSKRTQPLIIDEVRIPMNSVKDIEAMEAAICPEVIRKLKSHLAERVDNTAYKTALGMMQSLFTVQLMRKLNWKGQGQAVGKRGLNKIAPKFTDVLVDGAKEAVKEQWTKAHLRDKMMKVLVKATRMRDTNIDYPLSEDDDDQPINAAAPGRNIEPPPQPIA